MNVADSQRLAGMLASEGWGIIRDKDTYSADVVIVNTCAVRENAQRRALGYLASLKRWKEAKQGRRLVLTGCIAEELGEKALEQFKHVDAVIGARHVEKVAEYLNGGFGNTGKRVCVVGGDGGRLPFAGRCDLVQRAGGGQVSPSVFVPVMRGCNNYCSYCIVPFVRGPEISRPLEEIIQEVEGLVQHGVLEITLLGQNVNSYCALVSADGGRSSTAGVRIRDKHNIREKANIHPSINPSPGMRTDTPEKENANPNTGAGTNSVDTGEVTYYDFADLLIHVAAIPGLKRLRFMTSHPRDLTERVISAVASNPVICHHFHLPVQSGSNRILERMNRGYTREHYLELISSIRKQTPDATITTDIIVGFPGETDKDFEQTLDLIRTCNFNSAFTFKYSPRPGTAAAQFTDGVPQEIKIARLKQLNALCEKLALTQNQNTLGYTTCIMIEGYDERRGNYYGRTPENRLVFVSQAFFNTQTPRIPSFVEVKLIQAHAHSLEAEPLVMLKV